jgi:hypothetical protein
VNKALWLLLGLQFRAWLRYFWRSIRTLKGAVLALLALLVFVGMLLPAVVLGGKSIVPEEQIRAYGPSALLAYCVLNVLLSSGERAIYFSPAEVVFLFPAPLGRREVLVYKVLSTLLLLLSTSLVMMIFLNPYSRWLVAAYLGLLLGLMFMQLFSMAINLIATSIGARLYTRGRIWGGVAVVVLAVIALAWAWAQVKVLGISNLTEALIQSEGWQAITWPLRSFFDVFLATTWLEVVQAGVWAVAVDVGLLGVVLLLDVHYQETAAAVSERIYARLQRLRRGEVIVGGEGAGSARLSLPSLPWWGGIGPILWRQLLSAQRGLVRLLIVFGIIGLGVTFSLLTSLKSEEVEALPARMFGTSLWLTVFLTTLVPFDFRGDVDRIALLKTLPIPPWRLVLGQLLTPVLLITLIQGAMLAIAAFYAADLKMLAVLAAYLLPMNLFLFGVENLMFLLFPTRVIASTPGDFQAVGRNVLLLLVKVTGLLVVVLLAAVPGTIVWMLLGNQVAAFAAGWPVVLLAGIALVPPIVFAFRSFDVGRDTPE